VAGFEEVSFLFCDAMAGPDGVDAAIAAGVDLDGKPHSRLRCSAFTTR